jgi:hypothetical protein
MKKTWDEVSQPERSWAGGRCYNLNEIWRAFSQDLDLFLDMENPAEVLNPRNLGSENYNLNDLSRAIFRQ